MSKRPASSRTRSAFAGHHRLEGTAHDSPVPSRRWESPGADTPLEWYGDYADTGDRFSRTSPATTGRHPAWEGQGPKRALLTMGRLVFGGFFLYNALNHFRHHEAMAGYAGAKRVPSPSAAVIGSGVLLAIGGLSLITGARPRLGAAAIVTFLGGVTPVMHDYWNAAPESRQSEQIHFMKNMALVGAALMAASTPEPWPYALKA